MDKKPRPDQGSSWNDKNENVTNPNRRQEEDRETNVESPRGDQRATNKDFGSTESPPSGDEQLHGERQSDTSRRERQTEE